MGDVFDNAQSVYILNVPIYHLGMSISGSGIYVVTCQDPDISMSCVTYDYSQVR